MLRGLRTDLRTSDFMTRGELAHVLNGVKYGSEITAEQEILAQNAGLVVVFAGSDDLIEFRGAVDEEVGAYGGKTVRFDPAGLIPERTPGTVGDTETLRDYFRREAGGSTVRAVWCGKGKCPWTYETQIPHSVFTVMEEGDPFCTGIIFALNDAADSHPYAGASS